MQKLIFVFVLLLSNLTWAQLDLSKLGDLEKKYCLVELGHSPTRTLVGQTCRSENNYQLVADVDTDDMRLEQVQIQVIETMREKGFTMTSMSNNQVNAGVQKVNMLFTKQ